MGRLLTGTGSIFGLSLYLDDGIRLTRVAR
jgi:hypothetical protein